MIYKQNETHFTGVHFCGVRLALLPLKYYTPKILLSILWINLWFYVNIVILIEYSPVFFFYQTGKYSNDTYGGEHGIQKKME